MGGETLADQLEANAINQEIGRAACEWTRERKPLIDALCLCQNVIAELSNSFDLRGSQEERATAAWDAARAALARAEGQVP